MNIYLSKRAFIRLISFIIALSAVAILLITIHASNELKSRKSLEYVYLSNLENLVAHTSNLNSDLTKIMYVSTPQMLNEISQKLFREASYAKIAINGLPIEYLQLQNTNKLLSQVGDYCISLAKLASNGDEISSEQREIIMQLKSYCDTMGTEVLVVADSIRTGSLSLQNIQSNSAGVVNGSENVGSIAEGFVEFEEGFTNYPTLIYDGPFSDHIMQKEPLLVKDKQVIEQEEAKQKAMSWTGVTELYLGEDENSSMPSYTFYADGVNIAITKQGGYMSYMLQSRVVENSSISHEQALERAKEYLSLLGLNSMEQTYYEVTNNIMTINYAYKQNGVIVYTDLIKVSVALDNGQIVGYDARGFIVNNTNRTIVQPNYTMQEAKSILSKYIEADDGRLVIIPSGGLEEVLCYEFECVADDQKILVYINANTLIEEQILILLISQSGQLTV